MKHALLLLVAASTNVFALNLNLPPTMDAGSVQAKLKNFLFEKLEKEGPQTSPHSAQLTGSYREVVLQDANSRIACTERSHGMLAVQMFACNVTVESRAAQEVDQLSLPQTMSSGSVQAVLKGVLFEKLESEGAQTSPYEAQLTGSYSEVVLEDKHASVSCQEHSAGMLAVQTFACDFKRK